MESFQIQGIRLPRLGLGTYRMQGDVCRAAVESALALGYRHIDTAQVYENEREVGEGLRASGVKRDAMFVTTKVWTTHFAPNDLERSTKESLVRLRLPEVDLLLLHWPNPQVPLSETLGALAHAKRLGLTRHIGVSNFTVALIEQAVAIFANIYHLGASDLGFGSIIIPVIGATVLGGLVFLHLFQPREEMEAAP